MPTNVLLGDAQQNREGNAACWLRGVIPKQWLRGAPIVETPEVAQVGALALGHFIPQAPEFNLVGGKRQCIVVFGDASGGLDTATPELRRVGCPLSPIWCLIADV